MPQTKDLVNHFRDMIVANQVFIDAGIDKGRVYRQFVSGVKNPGPVYPCITIITDSDPEPAWRIKEVSVWFTVHTAEFRQTEQLTEALELMFHEYKGTSTTPELVIYQTLSQGNYKVPLYDEKTNKWMATLLFKSRIG